MAKVEAPTAAGVPLGDQLLKRLTVVGKWLLAAGLVGYLARVIYLRWSDLAPAELRFDASTFAWCLVCLLAFYGLYGLSWRRTLKVIDPDAASIRRLGLHRAFFLSLLSRYLPGGKVLNLGSRIELLKRVGGRRALGVESLFYEQLYMVLGALLLGIAAVLVKPYPGLGLSRAAQSGLGGLGGVVLIAAGLLVFDLPMRRPGSWGVISYSVPPSDMTMLLSWPS